MPYPQLLTGPWSHVLGVFLCVGRIELEEAVPESDVPACDCDHLTPQSAKNNTTPEYPQENTAVKRGLSLKLLYQSQVIAADVEVQIAGLYIFPGH